MSRKAEFDGARYTYTVWDDDPEDGHTTVTAEHPDSIDDVGVMSFAPDGEVTRLDVHESHRRRGVATGMWNHARAMGYNVRHSPMQTEDGRRWASAVGD